MEKYICIHGHFYQPPRENAWLEEIETQDSAYPFHDWNERITSECYGPNTASRILDDNGVIKKIINNYAKISFNFGPTLLSWLEEHDKDTYEAIIEADKISMENFSGHGSAVAQVYNHIIMPLANRRDKETQVKWGIYDFEHRFGRKPEGMWLAETAVDTESLEVLAEHDIKYTILAPRQAKSVRKIGDTNWQDVSDLSVNTKVPYLCNLPSGKTIYLFFYDGNISQEVAFNGLLNNGKSFGERLIRDFDNNNKDPQLVHIATDGESYGHHHKHGDMALAFCLDHIEKSDQARLTNWYH
ncbi:MAG: glycoside hydrolase, partial [Bacteroidota bacterium]